MSSIRIFLFSIVTIHTIVTQEILLAGKMATQSETWGNQGPQLAIDGDELTYSVAASEGNPNILAWWEVDLGAEQQVGRVAITSSKDTTNARYLQNLDIWLLKANREEKLCARFNSTESMSPNETKNFNCQPGSFPSRFVRISRFGGSYRPDALALAEVRVYQGSVAIVEDRVLSEEMGGFQVPLQGLRTTQSQTWGDHTASLAVDGSDSTFSIACITCDGTTRAGVGWWQVDFGRERTIIGIKLTTAPDSYNAKYLQDLLVTLSSTSTTDLSQSRLCRDYTGTTDPDVSSVISVKCDQPTTGTFLTIQRKASSSFRPDALAIAELIVYEA